MTAPRSRLALLLQAGGVLPSSDGRRTRARWTFSRRPRPPPCRGSDRFSRIGACAFSVKQTRPGHSACGRPDAPALRRRKGLRCSLLKPRMSETSCHGFPFFPRPGARRTATRPTSSGPHRGDQQAAARLLPLGGNLGTSGLTNPGEGLTGRPDAPANAPDAGKGVPDAHGDGASARSSWSASSRSCRDNAVVARSRARSGRSSRTAARERRSTASHRSTTAADSGDRGARSRRNAGS
jgi:hypothetical protein